MVWMLVGVGCNVVEGTVLENAVVQGPTVTFVLRIANCEAVEGHAMAPVL